MPKVIDISYSPTTEIFPMRVLPSGSFLRSLVVVTLCFVGTVATVSATRFSGDPTVEAAVADLRASYRRPAPRPAPTGVEMQRTALGKRLFFDPRLSGKGDLTCASCHDPRRGWTDATPTAHGTGGQVLARRTPTLFDLRDAPLLFWDGRAESLEAQALMPVTSPKEMNLPVEVLRQRLASFAQYRPLTRGAFGDSVLSPERAAGAIAAFERTISSPQSAFDRWTNGDASALSSEAKRGLLLFTGKARCSACHSSWRFTDDGFHDIGVITDDRGRGAILTDIDAVQFAFKTPTLRGVVNRGPYMHNGSEKDLASVIAFYNAGGRVKRPSVSDDVRPLNLTTAEQRQLLAFLNSLGDARAAPRAFTSPD
jgi:cytochrome c peroxidase